MGLGIRTSRLALGIPGNVNTAMQNMYSSLEKLATGRRINRASDDPAGLVISEQLRARIASLNQEIENTSAQINKYQTASSAVGELRSQLTDLRTLAIGASNEGANDEAAQKAYADAADYIVAGFNRTIRTADYNGSGLLDGSEGSVAEISSLAAIDLSSAEAAETSLAAIEEKIAAVDSVQTELGSTEKYNLRSRRSSLETTVQNLEAARGSILDTDYALTYTNMITDMMVTRVSLAMLAHSQMTSYSVIKLLGSS